MSGTNTNEPLYLSPFSYHETFDSVTIPISSWHPKLTPYRLLVLSTTIGLGTAKAYVTSQGLGSASTAIEWIAGVALFSVFFILGLLEPSPPRRLSWLLAYDLMDLIWMLFQTVSLTPPRYRTDEKQPENQRSPSITGYRLLTSGSVTFFGLTKAYLSYRGLSGGANAVDWTLGVLIASSLYLLGLYESNTVNLMPYLFSLDYSSRAFEGSIITAHIAGMFSSILWSKTWFEKAFIPLPDLRAIFNGHDDRFLVHTKSSNVLEGLQNLSFYFYVDFFGYSLIILAGVAVFVLSFGNMLYRYQTSSTVRRRMKNNYARFLNLASILAFRVTNRIALPIYAQKPLLYFFRFLRRFTIHIFVYATCSFFFAVATCWAPSFYLMIWSGPPSVIYYCVAVWMSIILVGVPSALTSAGCIWCIWLLVAPFCVDWESPTYRRTLFEF